jgi:thymidylate synthase (FAD)
MRTLDKGHTIQVHDHGFVRYIDHMGCDIDIVEAARVSYAAPSKGEQADKKLLHYLFKNKHTSPFEMCKIKFNIKMPIFVMRQFIRHRMQNVNEVSARYTELKDEFFIPEVWRSQDVKNKQSSLPPRVLSSAEEASRQNWLTLTVEEQYEDAYKTYQKLLENGVAREQARIVLPVGIYTEFYSCWDLNNLLKYFALRDDPHAQGEHQDYAKAMKEITRQCFPWVMDIYDQVASVPV